MMKNIAVKFILLLSAVIMLAATALPAAAAPTYPGELLVDEAGILDTDEENELRGQLEEISSRQQIDVAVVTVLSLGGKEAGAFADDYYDYNGYGQGDGKDGIMFVIAMNDRKWAITTTGSAIDIFTDAGQKYITDNITQDLSDGNYADAFMSFAEYCDRYIEQAKTGEPYDSGNLPKEPVSLIAIPISLLTGLVLAFIIVTVMKSGMKTVRSQSGANDYTKQGSLNITDSRDMFLYTNVSRIPKPKETSSGSSTHFGSSGTSHGGSSGSF